MKMDDILAIVLGGVCSVTVVLLIFAAFKPSAEIRNACQTAGGVVIKGEGRPICISREVIIKVDK